MQWLLIGILAQASASIAVYIDKFVLDKHLKDYMVVAIATGAISFAAGVIIFIVQGFPVFSTRDTILALSGGALLFAYLLPYMKALETDDPSRVVPLFQFTSIYTLILSYVLFHEPLTPLQLFGFVLVLISGFVLSVEKHPEKIFELRPAFWYMTLASLLLASALILFSMAVEFRSFWDTFAYTSIGIGLGVGLCAAWPPYTKRIQETFHTISPYVWKAIATAEFFNFGYQALFVYAVSIATPTLVALTESTQPAIVFIYGLILTIFFPHIVKEDISRQVVIRKLFVIALIVFGFYCIHV